MKIVRYFAASILISVVILIHTSAYATVITYQCEIVSNTGGSFSQIDEIRWGYNDEDIVDPNGWNGMSSFFIEFYQNDTLAQRWGGSNEWNSPAQVYLVNGALDPTAQMVQEGFGYGFDMGPRILDDNRFVCEQYNGWDDGSGIPTDFLYARLTTKPPTLMAAAAAAVQAQSIPEPAAFLLLGMATGLMGLTRAHSRKI